MKDTTETNNKNFLKTDGGKTKSNAIEVPSITLPKGGGAIKGIDEKFSVNAVNGTASFSVPLPFSPARGAAPTLSLSYNSGSGNSIFGLGWNIGLSSIKRKTDKGLPQYLDAVNSDTFLFSEAEDLVPAFKKKADGNFELDKNSDYIIDEKDSTDGLFTIRFYKPRIEGLFARIERWIAKNGREIKWKVTTKDNTSTLFGWTTGARICNPEDETKIFEWLPEFVFDDKGNCAHYIYKHEDSKGFDNSLLHNKNRFKNGKITYTNLYLEKVLYGNKTPYKNFGDAYLPTNDYLFSTVFDYGSLVPTDKVDTLNNWDFRPDAFSDYKAGFEIRTTRLCKRVLLFHHFNAQDEYDGLVRSINFEYDTNAEEDFTFLKKIHSHGYIKRTDGTYSEKQLPPMEFTYQSHDWNNEVKTIDSEDLVHMPSGLDEQQYQFTDLYNEGLNGILTEQANGWYYKHNLGGGKFEQAKLVTPKPSFSGLGSVMQLADLDADGGKQLVSFSNQPKGFFELDDENEWQRFRSFKTMPNIDFSDQNTRMLDLDGDGKPEVMISEDNVFTWYPSEGRNGFSQAHKTSKPFDEEEGPAVIFADQKQTIFLADMSGSGLSDIVRIRNGEVCYWPNLGYGNFGTKTGMDNAPVFDFPDAFNALYLRLTDIDGSGTTDIVYLGKNKFTCWKNLSGNTFSTTPFEINPFPEIHSQAKITITDLLGNGVACIVWSSSLAKDANVPLKYIDLMNSKKPHIMVSYKNNMGKEVSLEYTPSTQFYIEDKLAGKPWVTKLHFPLHCISKTTTEDKISGYKFVSNYKYHHGYYDHPEREFRGFGMVEQTDAETFEHWKKADATNITEEPLHQEPVVSITWHHTGAFLGKEKILNQFEEDYWYKEMERQLKNGSVPHPETKLPDAKIILAPGIDKSVLNHISVQEYQEALRACKGMALRSEIFALDAIKFENSDDARKRELTPFSVATHNCMIELIQPKGNNKHAVFVVKESEAITYNYERNINEPRIAHSLNIKLDEYGSVLESASVVYPRLKADPVIIIYSENQHTNDVITENAYRLRLPSEVKTFELKGVAKTDKSSMYYSPLDFKNILSDTNSDSTNYHKFDEEYKEGKTQRRLIEHIRSTYFKNNLVTALPLHKLESLALPCENYQLAYTPELVENIFKTKVNDVLLTEGKFTHSEGDNNWWIRSGSIQFTDAKESNLAAQNRFYAPISHTDPYGAKTKVKYYANYFLFIEETEDALGNKSKVDLFNFRTLSPQRMRDINNNLSEAVSDELGLVKAVAVLGKGKQADELIGLTELTENEEIALIQSFFNAPNSEQLTTLGKNLLQHASSRFVYDFDAYLNYGKPAVVAAIARETHFRKPDGTPNPESNVQITFEYSNGIGEVVMKKVQAEPGLAKKVAIHPDNTISITEINTAKLLPKQLRWIGNGRTIKNNKGNAVKQYEPYFSVNWHYEDYKELVETGVTPIMYYDAAGRLTKTKMPDGTFSKVIFDSWKQTVYDANDTVHESEWYKNRTNQLIDSFLIAEGKDPVKEKIAADKAAKHAKTPNTLHFDTLGRPVLSVDHNRNVKTNTDEYSETKIKLDTEGNLRSVTDDLGNKVMEYKYDMLGNLVYQNSMDAGQRWLLTNILGKPLRTWDERSHEFQYFYDIAHRPTHSKLIGDDGYHIFDRVIYGESLLNGNRTEANRFNEAELQNKNCLGQVIAHYDTGGIIESPHFDFKGQPLSITRKLFKKYKEVANWTDSNLETDLETEYFTFKTATDALGRITQQIAPDGSIITPSYNEAGLLDGETVLHPGDTVAAVYIKDIDYNEKGQREKIIYGNNTSTKFYYDKETFRLKRLESKRLNGEVLQNLFYTFDAVGNITHIEDKAIPAVFFKNSMVTGDSLYTYDALYRLVEATGRENNTALNFGDCDNWSDKTFMHSMDPNNPNAVRSYTQYYQYDTVGNIQRMRHVADGGSWTRGYQYETTNNRLIRTYVGDINNPANYTNYKHHDMHGFMEELPHLEKIGWNFKEEVVLTTRQHCTLDKKPVITYYQYDGSGQRIRKITENQSDSGALSTIKEERIYVAGYETYRTYKANAIIFERESLSLMDEGNRFVMVETVKQNANANTEKMGTRLIRYQLHNHLGSSSIELDDKAAIISYEEYHPFGTTAYQTINKDITQTAKRYRYTGMERDEETGLEYHSARYYLPWLGRWLSSDPIGIGDGVNLYVYCRGNPISYNDTNGKQSDAEKAEKALGISKSSKAVEPTPAVQDIVAEMAPGPSFADLQREADKIDLLYYIISHPLLSEQQIREKEQLESMPSAGVDPHPERSRHTIFKRGADVFQIDPLVKENIEVYATEKEAEEMQRELTSELFVRSMYHLGSHSAFDMRRSVPKVPQFGQTTEATFKIPTIQQEFQQLTMEVFNKLNNNRLLIPKYLKPHEIELAAKAPWLERVVFGNAMERAIANAIAHKGIWNHTGDIRPAPLGGADFMGRPGTRTEGHSAQVTTKNQYLKDHLANGAAGTIFGLYPTYIPKPRIDL